MKTNEQAPACCPFCGAEEYPHIMESLTYANLFRCGTRLGCRGSRSRTDQSHSCIIAERERLTREREDLATRATALAVQVDELTRELEAHAHDLSPAMVQARNDQLTEENAKLLARVKRLEEAGDAMAADDSTAAHLVEDWEKAKEAKP